MQRTIKYEKIKTYEKNYKIYFLWKKMRPKSVVLREKSSKSLKKLFFEKKNFPAYLCRYDLQNSERKFMLNKWVSRYLSFGDFNVPKNCSSQ